MDTAPNTSLNPKRMKREVLCRKGFWLGPNRFHNCFIRVNATLMTSGEWHCLLTFPEPTGFTLASERVHKTVHFPCMSFDALKEELSKTEMTLSVDFERKPEIVAMALLKVYC